jgi:hypothetical protein
MRSRLERTLDLIPGIERLERLEPLNDLELWNLEPGSSPGQALEPPRRPLNGWNGLNDLNY